MRQACVRRRRRSHSHICTTIGWCSVGEVIKMHHSPEVLNDTNHTLGYNFFVVGSARNVTERLLVLPCILTFEALLYQQIWRHNGKMLKPETVFIV